MADAKEQKTVFLRGLPLDVTIDKLSNYCGPNVQLNQKGKPTICIFNRKDGQKTVSAKVTFTHNPHANAFLYANNGKKFPNCETQLHISWFGEKKIKGENKAKAQVQEIVTPQQAVIVDGLPKRLDKRAIHAYFQNEVGEVKITNSQPMIDILEKTADKQKVCVIFPSVAEARICRLKLDGTFYNNNPDYSLRVTLQEQEPKAIATIDNQKKEKRQRVPKNRNKDQPKPPDEGTSADATELFAVHISNLPTSVEIPTLFFFLTEHVTGISRWDNWVPKIKILNRESGRPCAMVTFDTDLELKECIRKLNGCAYNNDMQCKLRVRQFFEKAKQEASNRGKPDGIAALSLDDLPGPHNPEMTKKKNEPTTRKEKATPKKCILDDLPGPHNPERTKKRNEPTTRKEQATPKKGPVNTVPKTSKPPTPSDNAVSPLGCKVLMQGIPLSVLEVDVISFITEPIIRTPLGTPLVTLFPLKPNSRSRTALVHLVDILAATRFIQQWNGKFFPLHAASKQLIIKLHQDRPSHAANRNVATQDGNVAATPLKQIVWNVVFVAGLPKSVTPEQVKDVFKHCGEIRRVNLFENEQKQKTGCGTVSFANMGSAERCINIMNKIIFTGSDKAMLVKFFEASVKRQENQTGRTAPRVTCQTAGNGERKGVQLKAFDCIVCFETCEENEMIGCVPIDKKDFDQNSHYICMGCARLHSEALITDGEVGKGGAGLPCCTTGCTRVILRAHVMKLLDRNTARLLDKRMTSVALLGIAGIEYCIRCDYGEFIEANTIQIQYFHCRNVVCRTSFCRICKVDSARHRGKKCDEADPNQAQDKARKKYEEELSATVIRICPTCRTQFQKLDGCNKMVCQNCKTTMCYLCRETGINYDHFRYGSKCGQDADSTAYDQARLNEVRSKYSNTAGGSRNTAETSFFSGANQQRAPYPQTATNNTLYYGQPYHAVPQRPNPDPYMDPYRGYARRPDPQPVVEPKNNAKCTIC